MNEIKNENGHWNAKVKIDKVNNIGFIYIITHKDSKKYYIGCKMYFNKFGKKKKEMWQNYTSSSVELNKLIDLHGKDRFNFMIIDQAPTKSMLKYKELLTQIKFDVMFDPNALNGILQVRINRKALNKL